MAEHQVNIIFDFLNLYQKNFSFSYEKENKKWRSWIQENRNFVRAFVIPYKI